MDTKGDEMKALEILVRITRTPQDLFRYSDKELDEAIAELEALQSRSCEGCEYLYINKHSEFVEYCTDLSIEIPYSDITTFCCNRYEPKEQ